MIAKSPSSKTGFTLVEIMIVVVIIGLTAALAIPALQKARSTSSGRKADNFSTAPIKPILQAGPRQAGSAATLASPGLALPPVKETRR